MTLHNPSPLEGDKHMALMVELEGRTVPLNGCQYVLWEACGCPRGVSLASEHRPDPVITEDDAWRMFFDRKRDRERAQRNGLRIELMTHDRYSREVYPLMLQRTCPHRTTAKPSDVPQRDTLSVPLRKVDAGRDRKLLLETAQRVIDSRAATVSWVQRNVRVGSVKATALLYLLEDAGIVGQPEARSARREVLVPREERDAALAKLRDLTREPANA